MDSERVQMQKALSRRDFLRVAGSAAAVGAGVVLLGACGSDDETGGTSGTIAAGPLETTRIRLTQPPSICVMPQYLAEEFLRADGFTDIEYVKLGGSNAIATSLASGEADISLNFATSAATRVDAGDPVVIIAGAHVGCWELVGTDRIQSITDLRGKTVAVGEQGAGGLDHLFFASALSFVGVDLTEDITIEAHTRDDAIQLLKEGKVDAYVAFPPTTHQLRAENIGHVVVSSHHDPPWSQYFCCLVAVNRGFYENNPVATKSALRAILKGTDVCSREPERAARFVVDKGYTDNYEYALATVQMLPYNVWREFDPEDTLRFYSLRLEEAGYVKSTPDEIIERGTDWRLLGGAETGIAGVA